MNKSERIKTLKEFYPYYLSEHQHPVSRILHFSGTALLLILLIYSLVTEKYTLIWLVPLLGYGFAWVGHYFFEKNKPATFRYPFYSLASDFMMFYDLITGKIRFYDKKSQR
jgi:hypothetical protein